jgi:hypothetical protein
LARLDLTEEESDGLLTISHCLWLKITTPGIQRHGRNTRLHAMASKAQTLIFLEGFDRYRGFTCERKTRLDHNTYK